LVHSSHDNLLGSGEWEKLRPRIHEIRQLFDLEGTWKAKDTPLDNPHGTLETLKMHGAVKTITKEIPEPGQTPVCVYQWREDVKQKLKDHWKKLDKLPCGHRAHIYNHPEREGFSCKYCEDWPKYDRETIEQCL
jgi:hypothetical protein